MSKKIIGLLSLIAVMGIAFVPLFSYAQLDTAVSLTPTAKAPPSTNPLELLAVIIKWLFGFLIVVVVLMVMISAYMFVTAGGNPEQVGKARNWLVYALIGLAIGVLARGLVELLLRVLSDVESTTYLF
jgi:amino acid transporter